MSGMSKQMISAMFVAKGVTFLSKRPGGCVRPASGCVAGSYDSG